MKCTAVIVTYNRLELLKEALSAIEAQTRKPDELVIIDNCSTDGTDTFLGNYTSSIKLSYNRLDTNTGGAGGFYQGIKEAYAGGADWIWIMDDDCIAHDDALEQLIAATGDIDTGEGRPIGYVASRVLWTDGSPCLMNLPVPHWTWIESHDSNQSMSRIVGSSFVSMLINRQAIRELGLPVKEFFIWFDDAEYSRRISASFRCYLASNSVVTHKVPTNLGPLDFKYLDDNSKWKYWYGIRNEVAFFYRGQGMIRALLFVLKCAKRMWKAGGKRKYFFMLTRATISGFLFNYKKYIARVDE